MKMCIDARKERDFMDAQSPRAGRCPINAQPSDAKPAVSVDEYEKIASKPLKRRTLLKVGGAGAVATSLASIGAAATWAPRRAAGMAATVFPDIQFDIGA